MKGFFQRVAALVILFYILPQSALAAELLIPVGKVVGLELRDDTVTVTAFDDALGGTAREAGLKIGDRLLTIDGTDIHSASDVRSALERSDGRITMTIARDGHRHRLELIPAKSEGIPRLGVYLRQGIAGMGTVTYYDPDTGEFGALGHGVSSAGGELLAMTWGSAYPGRILTIQKGVPGQPGQLRGSAQGEDPIGKLRKNTPRGVFGTASKKWLGQLLPVADFGDVHPGDVVILSDVAGQEPREYSAEILKIYPQGRPDSRNFLLRVTDPELLALTGGIVQGMGVIDNRDNTKKPGNTGFFNSYPKNDPTIGV